MDNLREKIAELEAKFGKLEKLVEQKLGEPVSAIDVATTDSFEEVIAGRRFRILGRIGDFLFVAYRRIGAYATAATVASVVLVFVTGERPDWDPATLALKGRENAIGAAEWASEHSDVPDSQNGPPDDQYASQTSTTTTPAPDDDFSGTGPAYSSPQPSIGPQGSLGDPDAWS